GSAARRRVLRTYASPFPRENRLLLVSPNVTTLFVKRGKEMHDAIAREIGGIAAVVPGNVAAFFPSYELLGEAHGRLRAARVPKVILVERPDWSKTQRDGALEALRRARPHGRAIRSERDRAAIVLLEGRILEPRYARCLPPDFAPARSEGAASEASRFLQPPA